MGRGGSSFLDPSARPTSVGALARGVGGGAFRIARGEHQRVGVDHVRFRLVGRVAVMMNAMATERCAGRLLGALSRSNQRGATALLAELTDSADALRNPIARCSPEGRDGFVRRVVDRVR